MNAIGAIGGYDDPRGSRSMPGNAEGFEAALLSAGLAPQTAHLQLVNTAPQPAAPLQTTPDGVGYDGKISRQMAARGWTPEQIDEAVKSGDRIAAVDRATGAAATRYVNPATGQSVVINNATNSVVQVGKPGFRFGTESGDVPGARMRPPPAAAFPGTEAEPPAVSEAPVTPEPLEIPDIILPP